MRMMSGHERRSKGDLFEVEIGEIYEAMGYQVQRCVSMHGQEVDLLAFKEMPGAGLLRVLIECKYKGGSTLAGNEDVQSIAGAYQIAKASNDVSACVLVTTNGFSLPAQEAARAAGIELRTKGQLLRSLIDFSSYLASLVGNYFREFGDTHRSWYIDASGTEAGHTICSLDSFVDDWLMSQSKSPLALLGGYGTGKTSFCLHYSARLASRSQMPIPILLQLRDFRRAFHIESVIRDFLEEKCNTQSPQFEMFWRMYQEGMLLLLFDGFDEMAAQVDASIIEANLLEIDRFASFRGNVILTCRPEHFITNSEEECAFNPLNDPLSGRMTVYRPIQIRMWSPEQVTRYIERRVSGMTLSPSIPPSYYLDMIQRLPELQDLSTRAVHLDLIVKMLPRILHQGIPITRSNLYDIYIRSEFRRETVKNKRLRKIPDEDRVGLLQHIAADRFFEGKDDISFERAAVVIKRFLGLERTQVEAVTRDFLNRSFLRRNGDSYTFAHKSFGEYLCAKELYIRIIEGAPFPERIVRSKTVPGMVLELFGGVPAFEAFAQVLGVPPRELRCDVDMAFRVVFAGLAIIYCLSSVHEDSDRQNNKYNQESKMQHSIGIHQVRVRLHRILDAIEICRRKDHEFDLGEIVIDAWTSIKELLNIAS